MITKYSARDKTYKYKKYLICKLVKKANKINKNKITNLLFFYAKRAKK